MTSLASLGPSAQAQAARQIAEQERKRLVGKKPCPQCLGTGVLPRFDGNGVRCKQCKGSGLIKEPKPSKYKAKAEYVDNIRFASKREAVRYQFLKVLEREGVIRNVECQPEFRLIVNGKDIGRFRADFAYFRGEERIIEDVKSPASKTEAYSLRKRIVEAIYHVKIVEVS